jgi:hypothetical protein
MITSVNYVEISSSSFPHEFQFLLKKHTPALTRTDAKGEPTTLVYATEITIISKNQHCGERIVFHISFDTYFLFGVPHASTKYIHHLGFLKRFFGISCVKTHWTQNHVSPFIYFCAEVLKSNIIVHKDNGFLNLFLLHSRKLQGLVPNCCRVDDILDRHKKEITEHLRHSNCQIHGLNSRCSLVHALCFTREITPIQWNSTFVINYDEHTQCGKKARQCLYKKKNTDCLALFNNSVYFGLNLLLCRSPFSHSKFWNAYRLGECHQ